MRYLKVLALMLVALGFAADSVLAQSPPAVNLPWNDIRPERISNQYVTIIGQPGTSLISGTTNHQWTWAGRGNEARTVALPFDFNFLRVNYLAGRLLTVGTNGYVSFSGSGNANNQFVDSPNLRYFTSTFRGWYSKVIFPYWADLRPNGVTNPSGGVYWAVRGTAPNRILVFEWRMQSQTWPTGANPGNFQCLLYENGSIIEFHYGPNSIDKSLPATQWGGNYGAQVGLKNFGQRDLNRAPDETDFNTDEDNFLLLIHPDQTIGGQETGLDTVAITRLPTVNHQWGGPFTPTYEAMDPFFTPNGQPSPYFHYSFPTEFEDPIAYRLRPVLNDIACDSLWFTPNDNDGIDDFNINDPVTVNARFANLASTPKNDIDVKFDVFYLGRQLVYSSELQQVSPGNRLGTDNVTFTAIPGSEHAITGLYEVRAYSLDPLEEDFRNDSCKVPYFIIGENDVMPFSILQPFENIPPLFTKYPVGIGVPLEVRFLNIGSRNQTNVSTGYEVYNEAGVLVVRVNGVIIPGTFDGVSFRDILMPTWTPDEPGRYCFRFFSEMTNDEERRNDTLPVGRTDFCITSAYEIELAALLNNSNSPSAEGNFPIGQPIPVAATFQNNGITDATNSPATIKIYAPGTGREVYNQIVNVLEIRADGGITIEGGFPSFTPSAADGPGRYRVVVEINNSQDPIASNNTVEWFFNVLPQLRGEIYVGFGERFQTIQEARDSVFYYGVSGDLDLVLVDDSYDVFPGNNDGSVPALDMRGEIVGAGEGANITWMPHPNKTEVRINLQSPSGIGIWFGQTENFNPSGYMTFDGGPNKTMVVTFDNTGDPERDMAVPFYFGRGSSNYTVRNVVIEPLTSDEGKKCTQTISLPSYDQAFNRFTFIDDLDQQVSAAIMLRNTMPYDPITGSNSLNSDTLWNQNNVFENNEISGFAYGILSVGAGPIYRVQQTRFEAVNNQDNLYRNNEISDVGRGGIVVAYETNSQIVENRVKGVENICVPGTKKSGGAVVQDAPEAHAAGIWVTAGGATSGNVAYSNGIEIERNQVSNINTSAGVGVGIWVENNENTLVTPSNVTQVFPAGEVSNMEVRNNMAWEFEGADGSAGIGMTVSQDARADYIPRDNDVQNNTIYNTLDSDPSVGIIGTMSEIVVENNLIAMTNGDAVGLRYIARSTQSDLQTVSIASDYNLFWVPKGTIGELDRVSTEQFALPSPDASATETLSNWRVLTDLDHNSLVGDPTGEFISIVPDNEDLHLDPQLRRSIVGNRGTTITDMTDDIDNEPRTQAAVNGRYDIGADEFWGRVNNNDLIVEHVEGPFGWGQFDRSIGETVEYVMGDSSITLSSLVRNIGGRPMTGASVTLDVDYWSGTGWVNELSSSRTSFVDVGEKADIEHGTLAPKTLQELAMTDPQFGTMEPNVTPIYRFVVTSGNDDNLGNNTFTKYVRFYVQRSVREAMITVESYAPVGTALPVDQVDLGNRLNGDSLVSAMSAINWDRTGVLGGTEDYDLFERDRWPIHALNFAPWQTMVWAQGEESEGMLPEERQALKDQLNGWTDYRRAGLIIAGQEVARIHDVQLNALNGDIADADFVQNYLRSNYRGVTDPAVYEGRLQGIRITPGRFEQVMATGVAGDADPEPSVLSSTQGDGIAQGAYWYVDHDATTTAGDSVAGMTSSSLNLKRSVVFYAIDWRHFGRFAPEADRSGSQRSLLAGIDFLDQFGSILPVELTSFSARETGFEAVTVSWTTSAEIDITSMEIERAEVLKSEAGEEIGEYGVIASRSPEGDANRGSTYRVLDREVESGGEYIYRLVSVEQDGSRLTVQSARVLLSSGANSAEVQVVPNPVVSGGILSWDLGTGTGVSVQIYNSRGEEVVTFTSKESVGEYTLSSDMESGSYTAVVRSADGNVYQRRFTVTK